MAKRSPALKQGSKIAELFAYIKREMIGTELIITGEQMRQLMEQLKIRKIESVYGTLKQLERKGLIKRAKRKGVRGIVVSFPDTQFKPESQQPKQKRGRRRGRSERSKRTPGVETSPTLNELIESVGKEVEALKKKYDERLQIWTQLQTMRTELKIERTQSKKNRGGNDG